MAGVYTEILEIVAPESAAPGSTVNVEVRVRNKYQASVLVYCVAVLDAEIRFIDWQNAWVEAGTTRSFYGSFVMPSGNARLETFSYFLAVDGMVYLDDSLVKEVRAEELQAKVSEFTIADYMKV